MTKSSINMPELIEFLQQQPQDLEEDEYHVEITKTYSKEGELLRCVNAIIPGEFEPGEATKKYWAWLDERRRNDQ